MSNSQTHGFPRLSQADIAARHAFLTRRRKQRQARDGLEYVPIASLERPDGSRVLVVKDEVTVPNAYLETDGVAPLRQNCSDVTGAPDTLANRRRYRTSDSADIRADASPPVELTRASGIAVVGGIIKGRPTAEATPQRPLPRTGEKTAHRPLIIVIDTGLAAAAITQPDATGHRTDAWLDHFELADGQALHIDPLDVLDPQGLDLAAGHGTFVAGLIRQVAHAARIVMIRAVDTDGIGSEEMVAAAIHRAARIFNEAGGGRGVLNISLGIETVDGTEPPVLRTALEALPPEVIVVAAAGNDPTGIPFWPAASTRALGVAALRDATSLEPAPWSNSGPWVDFSTRGEDLVSIFVEGTETLGSGKPGDPFDPHPDTFEGPNPFAVWSGTSFATAQVTGSLANLLTYDPELLRTEATQRLKTHGTYLNRYGYRLAIL